MMAEFNHQNGATGLDCLLRGEDADGEFADLPDQMVDDNYLGRSTTTILAG